MLITRDQYNKDTMTSISREIILSTPSASDALSILERMRMVCRTWKGIIEMHIVPMIISEAQVGLPQMCNLYGKMLQGRWKVDYAETLFLSAAESLVDGVFNQGEYYAWYGNHEKAMSLYLAAAQKGHDQAQLILGISYFTGIITEANKYKGKKWIRSAAALDNKDALQILPNPKKPSYRFIELNGESKLLRKDEIMNWKIELYKARKGDLVAQYNVGIRYLELGKSNKARVWLHKSAESSYIPAQYKLGKLYASEELWSEATVLYKAAAASNLGSEAQLALGECYAKGLGVEQSWSDAVKLFRLAASEQIPEANFALGECYAKGLGVEQSLTDALKLYREAASYRHAEAQFKLAQCYEEGIGITQSNREASCWYRKAAENNHVQAQFKTGLYYQEVKGATDEALSWYAKAAKQKHEGAIHKIGLYYAHNHSAIPTPELFPHLEILAESGDIDAKYKVMKCYQYGEGVQRSEDKCLALQRELAELGHPKAQNQIAQIELFENNNPSEALKWLEKAAAGRCPDAAFTLGLRNIMNTAIRNELPYGKGQHPCEPSFYVILSLLEINDSIATGVDLLTLAAELDHSEARLTLGKCYEFGIGVEESMEQAVYWYRKANAYHHPQASYELGICYLHGIGVEESLRDAIRYLEFAANHHIREAAFIMGCLYRKGTAVPKSIKKSNKFFRKLGDDPRIENLAVSHS